MYTCKSLRLLHFDSQSSVRTSCSNLHFTDSSSRHQCSCPSLLGSSCLNFLHLKSKASASFLRSSILPARRLSLAIGPKFSSEAVSYPYQLAMLAQLPVNQGDGELCSDSICFTTDRISVATLAFNSCCCRLYCSLMRLVTPDGLSNK